MQRSTFKRLKFYSPLKQYCVAITIRIMQIAYTRTKCKECYFFLAALSNARERFYLFMRDDSEKESANKHTLGTNPQVGYSLNGRPTKCRCYYRTILFGALA
jgi:hypothetical protein